MRIHEILNGLFASYGEAEVKAECRPSSDDHTVLELSLKIKPGWYCVGTKEKKTREILMKIKHKKSIYKREYGCYRVEAWLIHPPTAQWIPQPLLH